MDTWLLGTAGVITSPRRSHTSLALRALPEHAPLVVECGANTVAALVAAGLDWTRIEHVIVSHRHADHLGGLPAFVSQLRLATKGSSRPPLRVWGPADALGVARQLLEATELIDRPSGLVVVLEPLPAEGGGATLSGLLVEAFPVRHGDVPTLGLDFAPLSGRGGHVVYSADTEPCDAVLGRARDAELLVHECTSWGEARLAGHSVLGELLPHVERLSTKLVRLVHVPSDGGPSERQARSTLHRWLGRRVAIGFDGERIAGEAIGLGGSGAHRPPPRV